MFRTKTCWNYEGIAVSDSSSCHTIQMSRTPREVFLRSARLLSERCLPPLPRIGPFDLGLLFSHDFVCAFILEFVEAVEFPGRRVYSLMKLLGCRKATKVRKAKQAKRESSTILRLASLLSRRIIAGRVLGEKALSLSMPMPIMALRKSEVVGKAGREVEG